MKYSNAIKLLCGTVCVAYSCNDLLSRLWYLATQLNILPISSMLKHRQQSYLTAQFSKETTVMTFAFIKLRAWLP